MMGLSNFIDPLEENTETAMNLGSLECIISQYVDQLNPQTNDESDDGGLAAPPPFFLKAAIDGLYIVLHY